MNVRDLLSTSRPWLLTPEALRSMSQKAAASDPATLPQPEGMPVLTVEGGVAVIRIIGPMVRRPDLVSQVIFGATDTDAIQRAVEEAWGREDVASVLLDIDSPGGAVQGIPELAASIARLAEDKPVVAWTRGDCCSAAYWVASQADEVFATPSATVGSVGVILSVVDSTAAHADAGLRVEVFTSGRFKSAGTDGVPLTDEQRVWLQGEVDELGAEFRAAVLSSREVPPEAMEGQTFTGRKGAAVGLVALAESRADALAQLTSGEGPVDSGPRAMSRIMSAKRVRARAQDEPEPVPVPVPPEEQQAQEEAVDLAAVVADLQARVGALEARVGALEQGNAEAQEEEPPPPVPDEEQIAKAAARAAAILLSQSHFRPAAVTPHAPSEPRTPDEIRARFAQLKGPERTAFYRKHRDVLGL